MNGFSPNLDCFLQKNDVFAVKQLKIMLKKTSEKGAQSHVNTYLPYFLSGFCLAFAWVLHAVGLQNQCLLGVELLSFVIACIANLLIPNSIAY